jgi:hypothetical protein
MVKTLEVSEETYEKIKDQLEETEEDSVGEIKIVILQRGWVMVGRFTRDGNDCILRNAYNVRKWGTTQGLGELAKNGKLSDTVLDKMHGIIQFDYLTVIATIDCKEKVWRKIL